jgi:2-phospho-L-lactate guanylyltransferase
VPVKAFDVAKARLSSALTPSERIELARSMATAVVAAAGPLPVHIVCDHADVAAWALSVGAQVIAKPGRGLNGAVTDGVAELAELGFDRVVIAHADLPHARSFDAVVALSGENESPVVVIVPDRHGDGTNVICIPTTVGFTFAYGPGSAARHGEEARRLGLRVSVLRDERLGWDVDRPEDLSAPDWSSTP